ncbi:MAG: carboxypeptidase-like regulatory domain-containing protein [Bacteroidales bacterium]|nr:carboxypeptidase-like regulatory domain-containing protein [Bacteroidales bacterium]
MKLWFLIYFIAFIILPVNLLAQEKRVTLSLENAGIEVFLKEIQKQTGINYLYNNELISKNYQISISARNEVVSSVMNKSFKDLDISYKIENDVIVITPKIQEQKLLVQVIRGRVLDSETELPLPFASVVITTTNPQIGTTADEEGYFRIENVPIGRHNIQVSFVGYESQLLPELMVTTGKELVLNVKLKETISELKEIQIKAFTKKDKPLNSMSTLSARTFSVEEARRYAGGFDDPGRLAASFAGITTDNSRDNTIIIRGNAPKGLQWRLEGVEVSNPNHFANLGTFGGGGISALSALVLGISDFFTGAFPAEYGNAMSGVFDIKIRNGNNENYEHAFQLGTMGVDLSSEGPLSKQSKASYLFNYRYSTFGLMKEVFPEDLKDFLPVYQDLCFKINVPTKKAGVFSLWGLALTDISTFPAASDTADWEIYIDRIDNDVSQSMGVIGLNHRYILGDKTWINTSLAASGDLMDYVDRILDYNLQFNDYNTSKILTYKYTFTSVLNHKFSARHSNRSGFIIDNMNYDLDLKYAPVIGQGLISLADQNDALNKAHFFTQSKYNLGPNILLNAGIHSLFFDLNNEFVVEPRIGLSYDLNNSRSVSIAYGKHSRIEPITLYFTKVTNGNIITKPNKNLKVSKAHHFVVAFDQSINQNLRLKIEPYLQLLYDVPVIPDSNYSVINLETEWYYFDKELINTGTGRNYGIDLTLERFLKNGYYYLFTASFFDSKYKGDDGVEYNTRFNTHYVINLLYGKEWVTGVDKNKILGINAKLNFFGGRRFTPVNHELSVIEQEVVYFYSQLYKEKEKDKLHINLTINYRINKEKHANIWSFQMGNILLTKENFGYYFNYKKQKVEAWELAIPTPFLSYKIEF